MHLETEFDISDRVKIDGDRSVVATVTGVLIEDQGYRYQVAFIHNGANVQFWCEPYRLDKVS